MRLKPLIGLVLTTALLGVAACGDDGMSRSDYVAELNEICRDGNAQIAKIPEPSTPAGMADYIADAKKVTSDGVDRMTELSPPEELEADHEAQLADGRAILELADDFAAATKARDQAALQRLSAKGDGLDKSSDERAKRIGATDCVGEA